MAQLSESEVISELKEFDIFLKSGSPLLDKFLDIGQAFSFDAETLCNEWVAFSNSKECELEADTLEKWEGHLSSRKTHLHRTPNARRSVAKSTNSGLAGRTAVYSQEHIDMLFGNDRSVDGDLINVYDAPHHKRGQKRTSETTPLSPAPTTKSWRLTNGSTPGTPTNNSQPILNDSTPYRTMAENGMLHSTPAASYVQRKNSGHVMCSLNDSLLPEKWEGSRARIQLQHFFDPKDSLASPYQYMFQKVSEKSLILLERIKELGEAICSHNNLSSPISVAQPSLEPAIFTGKVVCEGEGHLNARSCLLEGPSHYRQNKGVCVRMEVPDSISCSLFPGQVIAVEAVNNYNGVLIPSRIYDEGVFPPLPERTSSSVPGFTMLCAAGPFTTSDNLDFRPLHGLLDVVRTEEPDVLLLFGPFLDSTHPQVQACDIPGDLSFHKFFSINILQPVFQCIKSSRTKLVLVPSQLDVCNPSTVYPQPPFQLFPSLPQQTVKDDLWVELGKEVFCAPDPATLNLNGLCVGMTSTDVLFHLSARAMFKGHVGDRMARVAKHILQQQCYYPLLPAFGQELSAKSRSPQAPTDVPQLAMETTEVNLDLIHMFDYEWKHACLPVRPDVLILPSNLKPFAKVLSTIKLYFGHYKVDYNGTSDRGDIKV